MGYYMLFITYRIVYDKRYVLVYLEVQGSYNRAIAVVVIDQLYAP